MSVVTSATTTSTVKSDGFTMPASSPTFRAINCIRPRAFMRAPTRSATLFGSPRIRAAAQQAPNLPTIATATHAAAKPSTAGLPSSANSVRSPEKVKNSGRNTVAAIGVSVSTTLSVCAECGITTPTAKAPKTA